MSDEIKDLPVIVINPIEQEQKFIELMAQSSDMTKEELSISIWQMGMASFIQKANVMIDHVIDTEYDSSELDELVRLRAEMKKIYSTEETS